MIKYMIGIGLIFYIVTPMSFDRLRPYLHGNESFIPSISYGNAYAAAYDKEKDIKKALKAYFDQLNEIVEYYSKNYSEFDLTALWASSLSDKATLKDKEKEAYSVFNLNEDAARAYSDHHNGFYLGLFLGTQNLSDETIEAIVAQFNTYLNENRNYQKELFAVQKLKISYYSSVLRILQNNFDTYKIEVRSLVFNDKRIEKRIMELYTEIGELANREKEIRRAKANTPPFSWKRPE